MRAVGYVRVSTEGQATEGVSLDAQTSRIRAWCQASGATLDGVHTDAGISGGRADNRPALQAALAAVCQGDGAVLIVYSLSRLARSVRDTLAIAERLEAGKADLVSLSEKIDTTSAAGKMLFRLLAVLAEFERDLISERTKAAIAHKRSKGERCGQIPYGFTLASDGKTLATEADDAETIALIRVLRGQGMALRTIAKELDARRIPTKNGRPRWAHSTVAEILNKGV